MFNKSISSFVAAMALFNTVSAAVTMTCKDATAAGVTPAAIKAFATPNRHAVDVSEAKGAEGQSFSLNGVKVIASYEEELNSFIQYRLVNDGIPKTVYLGSFANAGAAKSGPPTAATSFSLPAHSSDPDLLPCLSHAVETGSYAIAIV